MEVGQRLRAIRMDKGLSQRQLAAKSGVTSGMISLIEQNRSSPSVASLKKILKAIPMSLSEFFSVEDTADNTYFFKASELKEINPSLSNLDGKDVDLKAVSLRQVGDASKHTVQMLHECYKPGADTGQELISHEAEEAGIVISGEIEVSIGDQTQTLKQGDAYLFDSRIPHRFRNRGKKNCVVISACSPPSF